jgi:hypothetical protein
VSIQDPQRLRLRLPADPDPDAVMRRVRLSFAGGIVARVVISVGWAIWAVHSSSPRVHHGLVLFPFLYIWFGFLSSLIFRRPPPDRMRAAAPELVDVDPTILAPYRIDETEIRVGDVERTFRNRGFAMIVLPARAIDDEAALRFGFQVSVARVIRNDDLRMLADSYLTSGIVLGSIFTLNIYLVVAACCFVAVWWPAAQWWRTFQRDRKVVRRAGLADMADMAAYVAWTDANPREPIVGWWRRMDRAFTYPRHPMPARRLAWQQRRA